MRNILIDNPTNIKHLKRCIWALATKDSIDKNVTIFSNNLEILSEMKCFSSMLNYTVKPHDKMLDYFKENLGKDLFLLNPSIIITENALSKLVEKSKPACSAIYSLPSYIEEKLDDFGANLHPGMIEHCKQFPIFNELIFVDNINYLKYSDIGQEWDKNISIVSNSIGILQ